MELVDQGLLPHVIQLLHGICQLVLGQHRQQLQIHESQLRLAVGALVASHGGKGSPMVLEIQLTLPDRKPPIVLHSFLQFVKIGSGKLLPYRGNALHALLHTDGGLQHFSGRAAAAVAVAVRDQNVVVDILVLVAHPAAHNGIGMQHPVVGGEEIGHRLSYPQSGDQVGQNLRPVDAPPHHGIVGHLVELVPCQLRGHKVINTAFFHDLRQRSRVSEHVRQPKNPVVHAELFFKKALPVYKLSHQRLSGSQVAVGLQPHTALRLPALLLNALLRLRVKLRITLFQKSIQLRLTGHKLIVGVLLHQLQHRGKAASHLLSRLLHGPPPCHVDVRVADTGSDHILVAGMVRVQCLADIPGGLS